MAASLSGLILVTMTPARAAAVEELTLLLEAAKQARASIRSCEAVYWKTLKGLNVDTEIAAILQTVDASDARRELNKAMHELEQARHRSRIALIAAGLEEGMTIAAVGRVWDFSRQMAARCAKEARGEA